MSLDPMSASISEVCQAFVDAKITISYEIALPCGEKGSGIIDECSSVGNNLQTILYPFLHKKIANLNFERIIVSFDK